MIFFVTLLACLAILQLPADAQEQAPTAASVIEEFVVAKGGEAAIRKIKNYSLKGKVLSKGKVLAEFEIHQAANRHLSIDRFPDGSMRQSGTNGKLAWRIERDGTPNLANGQEARDYIRHNSSLHESLEWQKQFDAILYAGRKTVSSSQVHHLVFVAPDNRQINRYFSVESGLLIREEQVTGTGQSLQILVSEIKDYERDKTGVLSSRKRLNHLGSDYSMEYKIESVKTNSLADDIFSVPDSVAKLADENAK